MTDEVQVIPIETEQYVAIANLVSTCFVAMCELRAEYLRSATNQARVLYEVPKELDAAINDIAKSVCGAAAALVNLPW